MHWPGRAKAPVQTIGAKEEGIEIDVVNTPYLNTIHPSNQPDYPGDLDMEKKIHGIISWNAMMMVTRANKANDGIGHISTFASITSGGCTNHYYRGKDLDGVTTLLARPCKSGRIKSLVRR